VINRKINELPLYLFKWFIIFLLSLVLIEIVLDGYRYPWTGFAPKTFWDWLDLLIVPFVLASAAYLLNYSQKKTEQTIADNNLQENELQIYFDKIAEYLLEKNLRDCALDSDTRLIARANTLRIFRRLGKERKRNLLIFLWELNLISPNQENELPTISLAGVNLEDVNLSQMDLTGINLSGANLSGANLKGALLVDTDLDEANLQHSNLSEAKLKRASLNLANLSHCNLKGSNLDSADLFNAKLYASDIRQATFFNADLSKADLSRALIDNIDQLRCAKSLKDTILPEEG
jgi:uncharacterized protein YjbI with pentapeptide repeats